MLVHLALAFVLIAFSVAVHGAGTLALIGRLSSLLQRHVSVRVRFASVAVTAQVVSTLLVLHLIEASAWAALYWLCNAIPDPETAFYFSLTSYTTVGYGDVVLPTDWRLLGPLEAATGILMFGWSTSIMVAAITRILADQVRTPSGSEPTAVAKVTLPQ